MIVGVPREIKEDELRAAVTPVAARALVSGGHTVLVEKGAGSGCGFYDAEYEACGALLVDDTSGVWAGSDLVVKVKEPVREEYRFLREQTALFTFLHLAANPELASELVRRRVTALGYETVRLENGSLPLLAPMSEVAGCLAVQNGAYFLEAHIDGRGVLLTGICGAPPGQMTVIGGGVAGINACRVAAGMGAQVTVLDVSHERLQYLRDSFGGRVATVLSSQASLQECLLASDLVVGAVLLPGSRAPRLITRSMVESMKAGAVFVDVSIDQGGISETSRPTTHEDPYYVESGVVHSCITNLPAAVPRTSTLALSARTLPYVIAIAEKGLETAMEEDPSLREGLCTIAGEIVHPGVRDACDRS